MLLQSRQTVPPARDCAGLQGQDCVVVGLRKHALHVYDMRAGKRPAFCVDWEDSAVTALAPEASGAHLLSPSA